MAPRKQTERVVPKISLHNFEQRREEIKNQILHAAEHHGFFILMNQSSPSVDEINDIFELSKRYFALPDEVKAEKPFVKTENTGWEQRSQIRPSTGLPDQKESLQIQYHRRNDQTWPMHSSIPDFQEKIMRFMEHTHALSQEILSFFAEGIGFPKDFLRRAHDVNSPEAQTTIRLLRYHDVTGANMPDGYWRAGAHTDFDCLTMLYQRTGEDGLEVCPGRECHTSFGIGDYWTPVEPKTGEIVCNIGDMLMAWSDDRFKSLFHRVRYPRPGENQKERYSIAYFNQANKDVVIQGPKKKYQPVTAHRYILDAIARNFAHPGDSCGAENASPAA